MMHDIAGLEHAFQPLVNKLQSKGMFSLPSFAAA